MQNQSLCRFKIVIVENILKANPLLQLDQRCQAITQEVPRQQCTNKLEERQVKLKVEIKVKVKVEIKVKMHGMMTCALIKLNCCALYHLTGKNQTYLQM